MTWRNRIRLWGGLLALALVASVLTLMVNQRESEAFSKNGEVQADEFAVGSDYGGVVVQSYVQLNQHVTKGDRLFTVSSLALQKDLSQGLHPASTEAYTVDTKNGQVTYEAAATGTVTQLQARPGSFLASGNDMAQITKGGTQYVLAKFALSPKDYARIVPGAHAQIDLPNNVTVDGSVDSLAVDTEDGTAYTTAKLSVPGLRAATLSDFNQPGSPVSVTIDLQDDGILAGPTDAMMDFLHKIGLR